MHKINLPDISKIKIDRILDLLKRNELREIISSSMSPDYLCWDKIRHKTRPDDVSAEEMWALIRFFRKKIMPIHKSIIKSKNKKNFHWLKNLYGFEQFFHEVDLELGGYLLSSIKDIDDQIKHRFIARGIMEEAIASSQLEGANTTRKVAKGLILENRKPRTKDEKMILNNYNVMKLIEEEYKSKELSLELLLQLHAVITSDTLDDPNDEGKIRDEKDEIIVVDNVNEEICHIAPDIKFVKQELKKLIDYSNDKIVDDVFVHPVIKAIVIHFWLAYLHPFIDGNGRMARALFYWYLLKNNYWGIIYIPLSRIIKNSPAQYRDAYLYSEQDDNDLTYFIDYNIKKIKQAIKEFKIYLERKKKENLDMIKISRTKYGLNDRQLRLLQYCYKNKNASTSVKTYMHINEISRGTAINDLKRLKELNFLSSEKIGKQIHYYSTDKTQELFK